MPREEIILTPATRTQMDEWFNRLKDAGYVMLEAYQVIGPFGGLWWNIKVPSQWGSVPPVNKVITKGDD